jgi:hypothetical protein
MTRTRRKEQVSASLTPVDINDDATSLESNSIGDATTPTRFELSFGMLSSTLWNQQPP